MIAVLAVIAVITIWLIVVWPQMSRGEQAEVLKVVTMVLPWALVAIGVTIVVMIFLMGAAYGGIR